jgi:DNA polymerase
MRFYFDAETYSAIDLTRVGSWLYARHPTTDVRCVSYCLVTDGVRGPIETWRSGEPVPQAAFIVARNSDAEAIAFNNAFDRQIWEQILTPRYGWPAIPFERHRCAQAAALSRALPASLDAAAGVLKIATRKTKEGVAAMKRLARPRRQSAKERKAGAPLDFSATPEELATLAEYNRIDVLMMMEIVDRIGLLTPDEQALWQLDQRINERGIHLDIDLLETALCLEQEAQREVRSQIAELTDGIVTTPGQRDRILKWPADHGCALSNLRKPTVADALLEPKLSAPARQLLELRRSGAGAAAGKFATLRRWIDEQNKPRIRYAYRFHGTSSGRWSSIGAQVHNLRKPEIENVREAIEAVATGSLSEMRRRGFERPSETLGHVTRAVFRAPPGKRLLIADLSGVEARGAANIVGATAELEQWRTSDCTGQLEDEPYYRTGIATFAQPPATARKGGKTDALAFQYQGGVHAYRKVTGDDQTSDEIILARRDAWRRDHPEHKNFWQLAVFQAVQAIRHPGQEFTARAITFQYDLKTGFLEMMLPSGRQLTYPAAELFEDERYNTTSFTFLDASGSKTGRMYHERKGGGVFGGLLLENITQAVCRDIFAEAMPRLEAAGYPIVMHTHDEWVCEVPEDFGSLEEFLALITAPPSWAPNLPIAAKGRISDRLIEILESKPKAVDVAADNTIDNTLIEDEEDDGDDDIEPAPSEPAQVCIHCHRQPPDGLERESAYDGAWLHPQCEKAFIQARMAEEGLRWEQRIERPPPLPPTSTPPPPPISANGRGASDDFDLERLLQPANSSNNGRGNGYPHGESASPSAGPATAEYIYKNAESRLYMRVVRTTGKSFPTYHWSGGEWVLGWPKEVVPYRLPELLAAAVDILVLICEGEKDVDTAARHGFIATTNPGGAGKWQPELTQYFQGKQRACIVEDNDAAGAKHTATVLKALRSVVPTIGVVRFPELPPGGDLSDYFERGNSKAGLLIRIEEALKTGVARPYVVTHLHEYTPEAQDWIWEKHLPVGALELLTGAPSIGKSLLQCNLIAIITTGRNWPDGMPGSAPERVVILTAEDRVSDYVRRLTAAGADLTRTTMLSYVRRNGRDELFLLSEDLDKLEQLVNDFGDVRLVAIDPITAFMGHGRGFDSHRASDVRSQLHPLSRLAEKLGVGFSAVTHPPKNAAARTALDSFIGSQAFIAAARVGHYCIAELGEEDDHGRRRPTGRVLFTCPKPNHSSPVPTLAYRIEEVSIGWDAKRECEIKAPRIVWDREPVDVTADEAIAANKVTLGDSRKAKAAPIREFLHDILAAGPVLQKVIVERGAAKGFSLDQLRRARDRIKARSFKRRDENLSSPWMWALPEHIPADADIGDE